MTSGPTHAELLAAINGVRQDVAVINTKLDREITDSGDHESRIRTLERHRNWLAGVAAAFGGLTGFLQFWGRSG